MHTGRNYSLRETLMWTSRETLVFVLVGAVPMLLCLLGMPAPPMPWQPVAVLGTAVAFITGFKNSAAYGRLWEARKIWGGIVNTSRSFAITVRDFLGDTAGGDVCTRIVHRHIAWLTALRYQLRQPRSWETSGLRHNVAYRRAHYTIPELEEPLAATIQPLLSEADWQQVADQGNRALQLLSLQSADLRQIASDGSLSDYRYVEIMRQIGELVALQGKTERIKNFPYPRQYATLNLFFIWLFILLLPIAIVDVLQSQAPNWLWLTVPLTVVIAWVFHTMDKIGSVSENPFEGSPNDVPITAISRTIEIDVRAILGESELPPPLAPAGDILM